MRSISKDESALHFGWLADFVAIDNPTSSDITRSTLGWQPQQPGLLADLQDSGYFARL